jgi:hypothetical protein
MTGWVKVDEHYQTGKTVVMITDTPSTIFGHWRVVYRGSKTSAERVAEEYTKQKGYKRIW